WIAAMEAPELGTSCTFQLSGVYKPLQKFLDTTTHTPNQVIAAQHACPLGLSVEEFLAFGHLRAGNWLQWRNIIRALRTQSLTFSESSVYFLILQAIWQAGTTGTEGIYREAHSDLLDEEFCLQALNELELIVDNIGDNWMQVFLLALV
ncbi:11052_t:CDS:1, partial [Acaulospora colombiana]